MSDPQDKNLDRREFLTRAGTGTLSVLGWLGASYLLGGDATAAVTPCVRPPGALPEREFTAACIRCGRCADACPNRCIESFTEQAGRDLAMRPGPGQRGTPVIFPRRQACMLCGGAVGSELLCTSACPSGALQPVRKQPEAIRAGVAMGTAEVDRNLCYSFNGSSCGVCVRACPFEGEALRAGMWEKPLIDPDVCVGCGLCERACIRYPQAIRVKPRTA